MRDGDTLSRDGETLSVTLMIYPLQPDLVPLANAMQSYLRETGWHCGGYFNRRVEETIKTLDVTVDDESSYAMLRDIQTILADDDLFVCKAMIPLERALIRDAWPGYVWDMGWNHIKWDAPPNP